MKKSLALLSLCSLFIGSGVSAKMTSSVLGPTKSIDIKRVKDVYAGVRFHYLDQEDRIQILNELFRSIELEYALLIIKEKRIGLNFSDLKSRAINEERSVQSILLSTESRADQEIKNKIAILQAKSNLDFLDRVQKIIAEFQDTHFNVNERISRPMIYAGLRFRRVEGRIVLAAMDVKYKGLAENLSGTDLSQIRLGDELVKIDGVGVEDKINQLKNYISGSTDEFRDSTAIRSLSLRNILYPARNFIVFEFKNAGTFKLPIFANTPIGSTPRLDALTYLKSIGVTLDTSLISTTYDSNTKKWVESGLNFEGYSPWKLHANLKDLKEYKDDSGGPGLRTGYIFKNGKMYGVMQLLTFYTKNLTINNEAKPFVDAIRNFILELKENGAPLIFDLRLNGGGNGAFPTQVMSILAREGEVYGGSTSGFRMTSYIRNIEEPGLFQELVAEDITEGITIDDYSRMLDDAISNRKAHTPMFNFAPIFPDPKVKGFNNKIVALVTADCISACDKMASLLKTSRRGTIIGTSSNGTGAGYRSSSELDTKWTDSLRVFESQIPNYLFGEAGDVDTRIFGEDSVFELNLENKPTIADVLYRPTFKDFGKNNIGWIEKAVEVIEAK